MALSPQSWRLSQSSTREEDQTSMAASEREADSTGGQTERATIVNGAAHIGHESAGCIGAACGAVVRLEEQAALDDYEADVTAGRAAAASSEGQFRRQGQI